MKSKVFWIEPPGAWEKFDQLLTASGIEERIKEGDIVAIKMHFGELGNIRYIRPTFARKIVEMVKRKKGLPFLTDTTTLYRRARHTLFDYLKTAAGNGFTAESMGCPVIIADGLRGTSGKWIKLETHEKFNEVKVAQSIFEADFLIVLSHITFHPDAGLAASVKNVAMGCVTKETKLAMHSSEAKPVYDEEKCINCLRCVNICPGEAFWEKDGQVLYEPQKCIGCGECVAVCPSGAITIPWESMLSYDVQRGIIDGFRGVSACFKKDKLAFINIGFDVTLDCDCVSQTKLPAVPDIGILASLDAFACDKAAHDLVVKAPSYPGSQPDRAGIRAGEDKIKSVFPEVDMPRYWQLCEKSDMGNLEYQLKLID